MIKHAIITGASSGLGFETALLLANDGWDLTLICRNKEKTKKCIDAIKKDNKANVNYLIADFIDLNTVKSACSKLLSFGKKIDVIINNAGCLTQGRRVSQYGWEYSLAINYLAPFLIINLLDPLLYSYSRIINVNSSGHAGQSFNVKDLNAHGGFKAYSQSKMLNALMVIELMKRNRLAYCADPGAMATNFGGNLSPIMKLSMSIIKPFLPSPKSSAKQSFYLATASESKLKNGGYYLNKQSHNYSLTQITMSQSTELWEETELLLNQYL